MKAGRSDDDDHLQHSVMLIFAPPCSDSHTVITRASTTILMCLDVLQTVCACRSVCQQFACCPVQRPRAL